MPTPNSKLLGLLAACLSAFGQASADRSATLQGIITNSVTGEPVLRAHIALRPMDGAPGVQNPQKRYGALTTVEGKFSITGMDPGHYNVALEKTGFVSAADLPAVTLQPGDRKDDLKLKLVPTGSITGRVLNAAGEPVVNALVTAEMGLNDFGANTRTDEKGQFRLGGLTPGKYRVRAAPDHLPVPPEIRTDGTKEVHYAATYYPGALLPRDAVPAQARPGVDTGGVDIRLVRTPIVRVSGTVSGVPPGIQYVVIEVKEGRKTTTGIPVKADGTFALWRLNPGKYTIAATWASPTGTHMQSSQAEIEVSDANIDRVALHVFPPIELAGHLEYDDDRARPQDPSTAPQPPSGPQPPSRPQRHQVMLTPVDNFLMLNAEVGADDSFHLGNLSPNRYRVGLTWGPVFVKSMRLGSTQIDGAVLDLSNGPPGAALTLVVSSATATLTGTVSDDNGSATSAMVILLSEDWQVGGPTFYVPTKPNGGYSIGSIAPGKYRICALDEADRDAILRSGNLEGLSDVMESIEFHASDKLTRDLKKIKP